VGDDIPLPLQSFNQYFDYFRKGFYGTEKEILQKEIQELEEADTLKS